MNYIPIAADGQPMPPAVRELTNARLERIAASPVWREVSVNLARASDANLSRQGAYEWFRKAALKMGEAIGPDSACRGKGCSSCCSIGVALTDVEAVHLGGRLKITPRNKNSRTRREDLLNMSGTPCVFLRKGSCGIYAARPVECILHHSLGPSPDQCSTLIPAEDSCVPYLNLMSFWTQFTETLKPKHWGDIRSWFPADVAATVRDRVDR